MGRHSLFSIEEKRMRAAKLLFSKISLKLNLGFRSLSVSASFPPFLRSCMLTNATSSRLLDVPEQRRINFRGVEEEARCGMNDGGGGGK